VSLNPKLNLAKPTQELLKKVLKRSINRKHRGTQNTRNRVLAAVSCHLAGRPLAQQPIGCTMASHRLALASSSCSCPTAIMMLTYCPSPVALFFLFGALLLVCAVLS